jgi:hypothetical protein
VYRGGETAGSIGRVRNLVLAAEDAHAPAQEWSSAHGGMAIPLGIARENPEGPG